MNTFLGITANFSESELRESELKDSEYLYIEGYLVASPTGKQAAIKARELAEKAGVKVAITLSDPNMVQFFGDGLKEIIGMNEGKKADLLFCNEQEALAFSGSQDLEAAKQALQKIAKTFAITLGERGAVVFDGGEFIEVTTPKVQAVDSNGAGDMFAGAFLSQITQGKGFREAAEFACSSAAKVVSQFGPRLSADQAKTLLN